MKITRLLKRSAALFSFPVQDTVFGPFKLDVDLDKMSAFMEGVVNAIAPIIPGNVSI